jgi:hypothetical protein
MSGYAYDRAVIDPLAGVLRDAWHLYRTRAVYMLAVAAAVYGPAAGLTALITVHHGSPAWCNLADALATFLLIVVVAARPPAPSNGRVPARIGLTKAVVRAAPAAAALALIVLGMVGSESFMGHFEFVVAIPAIYLMFLWIVTVPVVVIEDLPALAGLRRSRQLIRGHGSSVFETLAKAYGVWFLLMIIPIFVTSTPAIPVVLRWVIPTTIAELGYSPFAAIALTLTYYRLAAAHSLAVLGAAEPDAQPGPDAPPLPAPTA